MTKTEIDAMSYEDMLRRVRFEPAGSEFFNSSTELGGYAWSKWEQLCIETFIGDRVAASKRVGWER